MTFRCQLEERESLHGKSLNCTEVQWLSRHLFLQKFKNYWTKQKKNSRNERQSWQWKLANEFGFSLCLNHFNLQLQGKNKYTAEMLSYVSAIKNKLRLLSSQMIKKELKHFKNLSNDLVKKKLILQKVKYNEIKILLAKLGDVNLEPIVSYVHDLYLLKILKKKKKN